MAKITFDEDIKLRQDGVFLLILSLCITALPAYYQNYCVGGTNMCSD